MSRALAAGIVIALFCAPALAQNGRPQTPQRAAQMRREAAELVRAGRLEAAFPLLRRAVEVSDDAGAWLELGALAERLRIDDVAIDAYQTYLARRPEAADRAEIEGRLRVLREIANGGRYVIDVTQAPVVVRANADVLVDWSGHPRVVPRARELISLAEWDGAMRVYPERVGPGTPGLGRQLSPP